MLGVVPFAIPVPIAALSLSLENLFLSVTTMLTSVYGTRNGDQCMCVKSLRTHKMHTFKVLF